MANAFDGMTPDTLVSFKSGGVMVSGRLKSASDGVVVLSQLEFAMDGVSEVVVGFPAKVVPIVAPEPEVESG